MNGVALFLTFIVVTSFRFSSTSADTKGGSDEAFGENY
jgi:hypothetical protein